MNTIRRRLSRQSVGSERTKRWNALVDLLATEEFDALTAIQRVAHLAFWYDSEVQNGGHLQYFENDAGGRAEEAILALRLMGGRCQAEILGAALREWSHAGRRTPATTEEYVENALDGGFEDFDSRYAACEPSVNALLEAYLDQHEAEFIDYDAG